MLTHRWSVVHHVDPEPAKHRSRADSGAHQELWGVQCAGGEEYLLGRRHLKSGAADAVGDPGGDASLDEYPLSRRVRANHEIRAAAYRLEICGSGADALAASLVYFDERDARLRSEQRRRERANPEFVG